MPDEERTNESDDHVLDLTRIRRERAKRTRDSGRAAPQPLDPQEALEQEQTVLDRQQGALDRDQSGLERSPEHPRETGGEQTALDRRQAALEREQGRLDRAQAALDRTSAQRQDHLIDDLTGTLLRGPGLRELQHEMDRARREGDPLVVAFIDVDGLKAVNDTRGHAAGDQLLRDVADALKQGLRSYDLVLRHGGDEFVCALSNAERDHAERRLHQVARILAAAPNRGSISWGLAELRADDTLDDLLARADASLYRRRGRHNAPAE